MLNKNQSKKWNSIKYALVVPVLVAFVFLFQMEVIAKEKAQTPSIQKSAEISETKDVDIYKITKNTTEAELQEKTAIINKNYGIEVRFTNAKRNTNNELTAITVELKKGNALDEKRIVKSSEAIETFGIIISKDSDGKLRVDFMEDNKTTNKEENNTTIQSTPKISTTDETQVFIDDEKSAMAEIEKLEANNEIASMNVIKMNGANEIRIYTKKHVNTLNENDIYINDKKVNANDLNLLDQKNIERMDVNKDKKTIRIITKNGEYTISNGKNMPTPPVPPTPPIFKNPKAPAFPKAPVAPKGNPVTGDKKAWDNFEKEMEEFEKKMKKLEPQMEAFDKQMAEFDKQMEPFNKQMEEFEKKMKIYEKQMEEYHLNQKK